MRLRFGDCEFDDGSRELIRAGRARPLSPKAFRLLELLIAARPRAVPKHALHDGIWPDSFVAHTALPRLMNEVRAALGDDPRKPRIIRTVHTVGYVFAAPVTEIASTRNGPTQSGCCLLWSGRAIPLAVGSTVIGRGVECEIRIALPGVSRQHLRIEVRQGQALAVDLRSKNGTLVDGRPIQEPTALSDGAEIRIGDATMTYCSAGESGSTETASARPTRT